ncbi:hypothetical protein [Undibacterium sp.]|uniref:hypothetical protein n=1 Tax=Undibacterium sp. TaxID=1914977 RepID=UPI002C05A879|nr:hypothetical protein [Undibacterium sp.]HTD04001.1 hypothetical protein [Undibacterium sp.]
MPRLERIGFVLLLSVAGLLPGIGAGAEAAAIDRAARGEVMDAPSSSAKPPAADSGFRRSAWRKPWH